MNYLISSHRVRGTMPLSMWIQHWLARMQRYTQMPIISDMLASHLSWISEVTEFWLAWGWSNSIWEEGLSWKSSSFGFFRFAWAFLTLRGEMKNGLRLSYFWYVETWALWSGMLKGREEISVALLAALIAAGRMETATAFTRRHSQGSTVDYSRRIHFI